MSQKECHVATLKESLVLRDKELNLLHRQPNSTAGLTKQINGNIILYYVIIIILILYYVIIITLFRTIETIKLAGIRSVSWYNYRKDNTNPQ